MNGSFLHPGKKPPGGGARNARRGQSPPARGASPRTQERRGRKPAHPRTTRAQAPRTLGPGTGASPRTLGPGTGVSPRLRATPKAAQPFEGALTPIPWPHSSRPWRALRFSRSQASRWAMAVIRCSTGSTSSCSRVTGWRWSGANGSGKSTLMKVMAALVEADAGGDRPARGHPRRLSRTGPRFRRVRDAGRFRHRVARSGGSLAGGGGGGGARPRPVGAGRPRLGR